MCTQAHHLRCFSANIILPQRCRPESPQVSDVLWDKVSMTWSGDVTVTANTVSHGGSTPGCLHVISTMQCFVHTKAQGQVLGCVFSHPYFPKPSAILSATTKGGTVAMAATKRRPRRKSRPQQQSQTASLGDTLLYGVRCTLTTEKYFLP
jgi:hypothetical protein